MSSVLAHVRALRETGDAAGLCAAVPYLAFLGLRVERDAVGLVGVLPFGEHLVGNPTLPALHGGSLAALLEATAVLQVLWEADSLIVPKTINLTVGYLRTGRPTETRARAVLRRRGRRVFSVHALAWQDDEARPVTEATLNLLIEPA